ncbi:MAG: hypothetical protein AAFX94_13265 [Myxococcota bacterium]
MSDERLRVPLDEKYERELGRALYVFATCEWNVAWCTERLQPGYLGSIERQKKTAGRIASDFAGVVQVATDPKTQTRLAALAADFSNLVADRNALFHAKPGTTSTGDQRLFRDSAPWGLHQISDFSDRVAACSQALNQILHNELL